MITQILTTLGVAAFTGICIGIGAFVIFFFWVIREGKKVDKENDNFNLTGLNSELQELGFKLHRLEEFLGVEEKEQIYKKFYKKIGKK